MRPARFLALFLLSLVAGTSAEAEGVERLEFQECDRQLAAQPAVEQSSKCFADVAEKLGMIDSAEHRLREHFARHPEIPWLAFYLGRLYWRQQQPRDAEEFYRIAAGRFAEVGNALGEIRAHSKLCDLMALQERTQEESLEAGRFVRAEISRDPLLIAMAQVFEAKSLLQLGKNLDRARELLEKSRSIAFSGGSPASLQTDWFFVSGNVNLEIGRSDESRGSFRELAERFPDDKNRMSAAQSGLLRVLTERIGELPGEVQTSEIVDQGRLALKAAEAAGTSGNKLQAHYQLGLLTTGEEALRHFEGCLQATQEVVQRKCYCQGGLARHLAEAEPATAEKLIDEAVNAIRAGGTDDPWYTTLFWGDRMRVSWKTQPHQQAIDDSWAALDAVEKLRAAQGAESQAGVFSTWSDDYYWFSGRLLNRPDHRPDDIAQAFAVTERLRGRTLLEKLAGVRPESLSREVLKRRLQGIVEAIKNVEGRVGNPKLPTREKENARQDLAALVVKRSEVERQFQGAVSRPAEPEQFATLQEVREALAPDEALLSFQVAPWKDWTGAFGGGSWLMVVTRGTTRVYPLPGREELRHLVDHVTRPLETYDTDSEESRHLEALYRKLLARALVDLPAKIHRLIIVPDDDLHKLPFAALRSADQAPPLAVRYPITVAPSATLWRDWRRERPRPAAVPALVLAAPVRLGDDLPPLPLAAEEGEGIVDILGGRSRLLIGEKASEAFLKSADLHPYGILHLATHSVIDGENPERSAVRLTPSPGEDGHLDIAGIVALKMAGKVVVLSTCESARGKILRGEGVMSLARAFFQAGAQTVVGSLWPVEDRDGKELFERFYGHIGEGASVAAALRAAQRDRIADGAPLKAWAGFVALGDGDLVPLPGGSHRSPLGFWLWALVGAGAALSAFLALRAWRLRSF
jgi:CHAT domain-containing protein